MTPCRISKRPVIIFQNRYSDYIHVDSEEDASREQDELREAERQEEALLRMDRDRQRAIVRAMLREVLR